MSAQGVKDMRFMVRGTSPKGLVQREFAGTKNAVMHALELMGQGLSDVTLEGEDGRIVRPTEFHLLLNNVGKFELEAKV
jgi:hypothetical protein